LNDKVPDDCRRDIAIINNETDLIEYLTLEDNIKFFMDFYHILYWKDQYNLFLDKYEINNHKGKYVFESSEGMLRKTMIIIALLMKPKLFLADEPIDSLDERSREIFFSDIKDLSHNFGTIPVFSLHNEQLLIERCTHIIYL
jgi:ABC-type multidrug transport system ATPase subunit